MSIPNTLYLGPQIRIFEDTVDFRQSEIRAEFSKLFVAFAALNTEATNKLYVDTAIGVESLRASTTEIALQVQMIAETGRANAAESGLQSQIDVLNMNLDNLCLYFFGNANPVLPPRPIDHGKI